MKDSRDTATRPVYSSTAAISSGPGPSASPRPYLTGNGTAGSIRPAISAGAPENRLLSSLERSSLLKLLPLMERVTVKNHELLHSPEQKLQHTYFPETSIVSEIQILEDGRTIEISMVGRESAVGLPYILGNDQRPNWTQATIPGRALRIKTDLLRDLAAKDEGLQKVLSLHLNAYIKHLAQKIVCQSFHSVEERFCTWLLMLDQKNCGGGLFITQEKISRLLGVHRPSITNIALKLRDEKLISYTRGRVHILEREKLRKLACSCQAL